MQRLVMEKIIRDGIEEWLKNREKDGRGYGSAGVAAHEIASRLHEKHVELAEKTYISGFTECLETLQDNDAEFPTMADLPTKAKRFVASVL